MGKAEQNVQSEQHGQDEQIAGIERLEKFRERLLTKRPAGWEQIPDIDLYMDQVISFMMRQHIGFSEGAGESLTPAMINNYTKSELLPRAKGKKYNREHIGYLTAICLLKQVLSVSETGVLLRERMRHQEIESFYADYSQILDQILCQTAEEIEPAASREELSRKALSLAVSAYSQIISCKEILGRLSEEENAQG